METPQEAGDNGKLKTPEQLKVERFEKDPDTFVEISELIVAVKRSPEGKQFFIGSTTIDELKVIRYDLDLQIDNAIMGIIAERKSKIIPAPHGIFDFVRKRHK